MENLKLFRKKRNLTQAEVAKVLDITVSAYGNYELGQRSPTPETLIKLANLFGCTIARIGVGGSEQSFILLRKGLACDGYSRQQCCDA